MIAATYTPFLQRGIDDPLLAGMLVGIWLMAGAGIALKFLFPGRYDRLAILLYLAMGWSGVFAAGPLLTTLSATTVTLIVIGGVLKVEARTAGGTEVCCRVPLAFLTSEPMRQPAA